MIETEKGTSQRRATFFLVTNRKVAMDKETDFRALGLNVVLLMGATGVTASDAIKNAHNTLLTEGSVVIVCVIDTFVMSVVQKAVDNWISMKWLTTVHFDEVSLVGERSEALWSKPNTYLLPSPFLLPIAGSRGCLPVRSQASSLQQARKMGERSAGRVLEYHVREHDSRCEKVSFVVGGGATSEERQAKSDKRRATSEERQAKSDKRRATSEELGVELESTRSKPKNNPNPPPSPQFRIRKTWDPTR